MGLFSRLFRKHKNENIVSISINIGNNDDFDPIEYTKYNNERIQEFNNRYDLNTITGIRSIPISEAQRYSDGGKSVVYMPEQILNRKATEFKKNNKLDLAIECLKKANEMYPLSFYRYMRDSYERLVDFLILAKKFEEARVEHEKLDSTVGTRLDEFRMLQQSSVNSGYDSEESYYNRVIKPYIDEEKQREEYYWLLENYPDIAPKSFGGYRKMKKQNSENYQKIVYMLEQKGLSIDTICFWKRG